MTPRRSLSNKSGQAGETGKAGSIKKSGRLAAFSNSLITRAERVGLLKSTLVTSALALIISYLAFGQLIAPAAAELREKKRVLATVRAQNEAARRIEATYPAFLDEFKQAWGDYRTATQLLPEEVEVSGVLGAVQNIAAREGVKVTRFDAVKEGGKSLVADKLQERAVSAQIVGTHRAVTRFLTQVASYPRVIHVREFSITGLKDGESVDLVIAAYYAPPPGDLPPLPQEVRRAGALP